MNQQGMSIAACMTFANLAVVPVGWAFVGFGYWNTAVVLATCAVVWLLVFVLAMAR